MKTRSFARNAATPPQKVVSLEKAACSGLFCDEFESVREVAPSAIFAFDRAAFPTAGKDLAHERDYVVGLDALVTVCS